MERRRFLGTLTAAVAGVGLASATGACSGSGGRGVTSAGKDAGVETFTYGDDPSQFLELTRATSTVTTRPGTVVIVHGGFWRAQYDLSLGRPLARDLARRGWTVANLEYRRLGGGSGGGGGFPQTFDDVRRGIDSLADVADLDLSKVVTIGHSAGGHLGVWAVGQTQRVQLTGAISQAGVLDLRTAVEQGLGGGAALELIGNVDRLDQTDPMAAIPVSVPVRCIHGTQDANVPITQSRSYVEAATASGADATVTTIDGDHFTLIDPRSSAWAQTVQLLDDLMTT